jgi:hypothetical protein
MLTVHQLKSSILSFALQDKLIELIKLNELIGAHSPINHSPQLTIIVSPCLFNPNSEIQNPQSNHADFRIHLAQFSDV